MLLYRVGDLLRGWSVFDRLGELERMQSFDAQRLRDFQDRRIRDLVRHTYENVPFYQQLWGPDAKQRVEKTGIDALRTFPLATKASMMEAGSAVLDRSRNKESFVMGRSSGSTGRRFTYFKDREHQGWWIATNLLAWKWAGWQPGDRWLRLQFRSRRSKRQKLEDWLFKCLNMPIDRFDPAFMRDFTQRAVRFDPAMVRGYAGGTYVYAQWLLAQGEPRLRPRAVALTGDTLYPHYREAIEKAFAAPVFDSYGGEGMTVALQCDHGTYHIAPVVHVDLVPAGPAMADGRPHRLILTSLTNRAMPFIRYDIGDLAIPAEGPCPCGRAWPGLKRIIGRDTDIVRTAAGRHLVVHHFNNVLRTRDGVDEFQVRQRERNSIELSLVTNAAYRRDRDEAAIREELSELAGEGTAVKLRYAEELPVPSTGKRRYIISDVPELLDDYQDKCQDSYQDELP